MPDSMNVIALVRQSAAQLEAAGVSFGHGTVNAFDEAAWLVLWRLGLPLDDLDGVADHDVSAEQQQMVRGLVQERIDTRKPAAYLTHEAWLQGIPFYVDERAIVPRSLIAEPLADGRLDDWLSDRTRRVLDLCTGNGSLAVLAALAWPDVVVDAFDISAPALEVARMNIKRHELGERITTVISDLLVAAKERPPYDLIVCNPPYVNAQAMDRLPSEYRAEPQLALAGGPDGMDVVRRIFLEAPAHMTADAVLVLEIGHEWTHFEAAFPLIAQACARIDTSAGPDEVLVIPREVLELAS